MAKIKTVIRYVFKGKEYKTLQDIKEEIHNTIGLEVIDKINRVCPPIKHKDLFNLLEVLCKKDVRDVLMDCYSHTVTFYDEYYDDPIETINVLDYKE